MGPLQVAPTEKAGKMTDLVSQVKKRRQGKCPTDSASGWSRRGFRSCSVPGCPVGGAIVHIATPGSSLVSCLPPPPPVSAPLRSHSPLVVFVMCARTGEGEGASDPQPNQLGSRSDLLDLCLLGFSPGHCLQLMMAPPPPII